MKLKSEIVDKLNYLLYLIKISLRQNKKLYKFLRNSTFM